LERQATLPERTSSIDIRAVVGRAVLVGDGGSVSTALLAEVDSGRYRGPRFQEGMYVRRRAFVRASCSLP
jgi:hypothetical protein